MKKCVIISYISLNILKAHIFLVQRLSFVDTGKSSLPWANLTESLLPPACPIRLKMWSTYESRCTVSPCPSIKFIDGSRTHMYTGVQINYRLWTPWSPHWQILTTSVKQSKMTTWLVSETINLNVGKNKVEKLFWDSDSVFVHFGFIICQQLLVSFLLNWSSIQFPQAWDPNIFAIPSSPFHVVPFDFLLTRLNWLSQCPPQIIKELMKNFHQPALLFLSWTCFLLLARETLVHNSCRSAVFELTLNL